MTISNFKHRNKNRHGYTLAEALITVVVLGIAAAGLLLPFTSGAAVQAEGTRRTLAAKLASDLMEQIIAQPFDQIVGLYNGYTEPQGQVKAATGAVFTDPAYAKFSRKVSCSYVYLPQESGAAPPQFIRVTIEVYFNGRQIASITRLIGQ